MVSGCICFHFECLLILFLIITGGPGPTGPPGPPGASVSQQIFSFISCEVSDLHVVHPFQFNWDAATLRNWLGQNQKGPDPNAVSRFVVIPMILLKFLVNNLY